MRLRSLIKRIIQTTGYTVTKFTPESDALHYDQDLLRTKHNHDFMLDPAFQSAYSRGVQAAGKDYNWHWRVHIGLWAAFAGSRLQGDFVECGVNKGVLSSAIMHYLNWNSLDRTFYLFDTFAGVDERQLSQAEIDSGALNAAKAHLLDGFYATNVELVKANFAEWKNVRIIQGSIPDTLPNAQTQEVAFLHIDMNCSAPEVAAIDYFWDRLVTGAVVLLDDYAYFGYRNSKLGMDAFASRKGVKIASLPTGQGLLIKPA